MTLINCKPCMAGDHNECKGTCLCASDNHGEKDKSKITMFGTDWAYHVYPANEPREYEKALEDYERLEKIEDEGPRGVDPAYVLEEYAKLLIHVRHMVSKFDLVTNMKYWAFKNDVDIELIDIVIGSVFSQSEIFNDIKRICYVLGANKKQIMFDRTQLVEAGEWVKGRYRIKRIDLTGNVLFFNGEYYETEANAITRRSARQIVLKPKNTDIVEIVKYIEDTCPIITWKDIENSIHIKCLLNGTYNIKTGTFSPEFSHENIILNQVPHNYNESEKYDVINSVVTELIPDTKSRQSFYDFLSTCLHPYTGVDYQFGLVGGTGTGKSQLGKLAELVIGEDNVGDATIHLIAKDQTTQKNMAFRMLNIDYDLNSESIKQIDVIKKWITQDKFTARGIYEQSTTFRPMSRLLFMANDLYEIANSDDAEAIYDRTYMVRVDKKYRHQGNEVKQIMQKRATPSQLDGMVTYLLNNATWIYQNETFHYSISQSEVESIWNTFGNRIKMFVQKWVVKDESFRVESSAPFNKWMSHCIQKGFKPKQSKQFSSIFNEIIGSTPFKSRINDVECYVYKGFRIKSDEEVAKEETIPFSDNESSKSSVQFYIPIRNFVNYIDSNYSKAKNDGAFGA